MYIHIQKHIHIKIFIHLYTYIYAHNVLANGKFKKERKKLVHCWFSVKKKSEIVFMQFKDRIMYSY